MLRLIAPAAALLIAAHVPGSSPFRLDAAAREWVEQQLASMSLEEKAGQLLMPSSSSRPGELQSQALAAHLGLVERYHVGGWLTLGGQAPSARRLIARLQQASRLPLLIAVDGEGGLGYRLQGATRFPRAMALAAGSGPAEIRAVGRATALEALANGFHISFYPVVDVNTNPANPIISIRSFGDDPARVGTLAAAYIEGLQGAGMLATAKHFPGHGDTSVDSHVRLPVVAGDRARLEAVELAPFGAAVRAGVGLIMTGHLAVPAIEQDETVAATLSSAVLGGLLRADLGFEGLIVTDALNMRGLPLSLGAGEIAVRAVAAGADLLLMPTSVADAHAGLLAAVASGRLSEQRLERSVRRILEAKAHLGLHTDAGRAPPAPLQEHRDLARRLMQNSITLARNDNGLLPLGAGQGRRPLVVSITTSGRTSETRGARWTSEIRARRSGAAGQSIPASFGRLSRDVLVERARSSDVVLLALFQRVADGAGRIALSPDQLAAVRGLLASRIPVVTVVLGSPYLAGELSRLPTLIFAFEDYPGAETAAVRAVFGEAPFEGRLPVTLPGVAPAGHGLLQ